MTRVLTTALLLGGALAIGGGGYWLGRQHSGPTPDVALVAAAPTAPARGLERKVLYYRNPMGLPDTSPVPKQDSMGMDYIPVYADETASSSTSPPAKSANSGKILYYRNPMGLADTSPVPKTDSMGMAYIPVYADDATNQGLTVKISPEKVQMLGVRSAPAAMRDLAREIAAVGTVQADERRLYVVNTKFDGWIEKLHVNATGQAVRRGQPLMEIYAPDLVAVEQEYLLAWRSFNDMAGAAPELRTSARQLADAALQRLKNWDISGDQIKRLQREGTVTRTLTLRAPANGTVMERLATDGMRFAAGEPLYRIADLSTVWLIADVFEQDLGAISQGQAAKVSVNAYPGVTFAGKVDFVYPTISPDTRTGKVRIVIANPDGRLKIGMYAKVALSASTDSGPVLAVPDSAVLNNGREQTVLVVRGEGLFEPRKVKLGLHADSYYAILDGLKPGEQVVVSANFLIDAESNLKAALKAFVPPDGTDKGPATPATPAKKP